MPRQALQVLVLHSYNCGLYSYGLHSYGLYSYGSQALKALVLRSKPTTNIAMADVAELPIVLKDVSLSVRRGELVMVVVPI